MTRKHSKLESVGVIIRQFRNETGMKLEDVAVNMDVSAQYVGRLETGKNYPSIGTLIRVAEAMGVCPGDMLKAIAEREKIMAAKTRPDAG